ncbi:MAG TPA: exo-alpha-sialidase, partial [Thermoguttaceae bacterium]|nr:exo-alpha-sialidase [Thermoguttaceae bacterium]
WKLQPLKYNHPGLVVDLGVGLWAWPMPMDYDRDGDMDLLVACPDKPSNGVYFFENPTQDPQVAMPVFKPGVRLGSTGSNMQVSYVDGRPRILQETDEIANFFSGDFATKERIYANARFHPGKTRARMWRYCDYEGDGDQDLIVGIGDWTDYVWDHAYDRRGQWRNGPLHGYVYLIENEGSDAKPQYSDHPSKLKAGGADIDVFGMPSPNFADFDDDGDLDLLCGEFLDGFTYFENRGTRREPDYAAGRKLLGEDGQPLVMDLQMITPTAVDWDRDGDVDLIVGDEDGRVALVEHTGRLDRDSPVFKQPVYFRQQADTLKFGALATPYTYDWDNDGDEDILCGNTAGYIGLFENLGNGADGLPKWNGPELLTADGKPFRILAGPSGSIQGPCEAKWGYTTLSVADWDADNDADVIYNSIWSKIGILRNDDGKLVQTAPETGIVESPPKWYWWRTKSNEALTQWRTTPVAIDFDGDGVLDLVLLDQEGYLTLRPGGKQAERIFLDEDLQPVRLNRVSCGGSGRVKLAVVDWDGDGRLDILTNSENATWYRNCKDAGDGRTAVKKVVLKRIGNLARRNVAGHTSSPAVCDFDGDGKPDLLVGAENGRIYHVRHDDCISYGGDSLQARSPKKVPPPRFPGLIEEEFVFTNASFPQCHASTICETTRGLVVAWFGGTKEKAKDVGIWASYHDGNRWSGPAEWANGIQDATLRHPCWNPVLFQPPGDAPTLLFFKVGPDPRSWWGEMMVSYDRGRSFSERRRLPKGIDGPVRCKPILLPDGKTLLCGSSTEYDGWRVHFEKATLVDGQPQDPWKRIGPINSAEQFNAIQPTFLRHADGTLQVLCRTKESVIATSYSKDDGETWSKMEATNLPNPNSGIEVVTLSDGRHLLIYNHLGSGVTGWGRRGMLNLAISDDGLQWRKVAVLEQEEGAEYSYPAIIQTSDGLVHMTYTWRRQRIKHVVVDPAKLQIGEVLSRENWHTEPQAAR